MGIDALGRVIQINPDFAEEHQLAVIDCLEVCPSSQFLWNDTDAHDYVASSISYIIGLFIMMLLFQSAFLWEVEECMTLVFNCNNAPCQDPDDTLKRKTLDLLYKMTKSSNVEVIVERMISYMRTLSDAHNKTEIASRIIELAERFAPSNQWFIQVLLGKDPTDAKSEL